jgi:hypothetical protein
MFMRVLPLSVAAAMRARVLRQPLFLVEAEFVGHQSWSGLDSPQVINPHFPLARVHETAHERRPPSGAVGN